MSEIDASHRGLVIRGAGPSDLDVIAKLEYESFTSDRVSRRSLRDFLRAPDRPVIAADIDGELAGYALVVMRKGSRSARIYSLAVARRFARRGVGRALLHACEAHARAHGRIALTLEVRYDNLAAIALYESLGYRQFGEHARYYSDGATALRYQKSLLAGAERRNNPQGDAVQPLRAAPRPRKVGWKSAESSRADLMKHSRPASTHLTNMTHGMKPIPRPSTRLKQPPP